MTNTLFYGDNLEILSEPGYFPDECVDLIYLDPPFNSSRNYNVLFKDESGHDSEAQITVFEDTWHWGPSAQQTYHDLVMQASPRVSTAIEALHALIGTNQMLAYLVMMAARLVELHRVLKPTGSLYLHCDPTASHYLKIVLDAIFGPENFRNEIVWKRTSAHSSAKKYGPIHDVIFYYSRSGATTWHDTHTIYDQDYVEKYYKFDDGDGRLYCRDNLSAAGTRQGHSGLPWRGFDPTAKGVHWKFTVERLDELDKEGRIYWPPDGGWPRYKRYLDELKGRPLQDLWDDIAPLNSQAQERLGYPTQKPLALLERIVSASSNPGDVVLDPFCGCGTAIAAAHKLGRHWIGIDITHLSVALMKYRLDNMFDLKPGQDYEVIGEPGSLDGARQLAHDDRFQFQFWALSLVQARPLGGEAGSRQGQRGKDRGIDGMINFFDDNSGKAKRVIVQVKSGHVKSGDIRDLVGTVEREKAAMGVFITLEEPSRDMSSEAGSAGYYYSPVWSQEYPRIQILTVAELLDGQKIDMPPSHGTFKQAERVRQEPDSGQLDLFNDLED